MDYLNLRSILGSIIYSAIGVVIFLVAYKLMERFLPFNVDKELAEDQNTAVGLVVGSVMIGLAIIIAAAIH
jgi:putative membrane protein